MVYQYTYHYNSGRRAIKDDYSFRSDSEALKAGLGLAKEKGRVILVKAHTYRWYNDNPRLVGVVRPDGSVERY